jgi:TRAP-type C4-dicarboxylate transport system permease small subunit
VTHTSSAGPGAGHIFSRGLNKAIDYCILALAVLAGIIVLFLLLAVCFATLSRYLFNEPFSFLIDYSSYSLLFIAFLGSPWLLQRRGHVSIDMAVNALPTKIRPVWCAVIDLVVACISAVICYIGVSLTYTNIVNHVVVADFLSTPKWILMIPIPVSSFFLAVQSLRNMIGDLARSRAGQEGGAA